MKRRKLCTYQYLPPEGMVGRGGRRQEYPRELEIFENLGSNSLPTSQVYKFIPQISQVYNSKQQEHIQKQTCI